MKPIKLTAPRFLSARREFGFLVLPSLEMQLTLCGQVQISLSPAFVFSRGPVPSDLCRLRYFSVTSQFSPFFSEYPRLVFEFPSPKVCPFLYSEIHPLGGNPLSKLEYLPTPPAVFLSHTTNIVGWQGVSKPACILLPLLNPPDCPIPAFPLATLVRQTPLHPHLRLTYREGNTVCCSPITTPPSILR